MNFDLGSIEVSGATGMDALFEQEPAMITPTKTARVRVASIQQLSPFERLSKVTLVHKSDRDLWTLKKDGNDYFIERLFDDNGQPLKG